MDNKEEHPPRGNEWEVVSLTASAYAAAPGPYNDKDARKYDDYYAAETSHSLFMSDHFVFPPSQHEDLPLEPVSDEIKSAKDVEPLFEGEIGKDTEELPDKFAKTWLQGEAGNSEQSIYGESALGSSRHMESEYTGRDLDLRSGTANPQDTRNSPHNLPCEAWWRRRAASVYSNTREANAIWSLFFAAAVTGLVVLGQRWQQDRWQVLQLKWQSSIGSEVKSNHSVLPFQTNPSWFIIHWFQWLLIQKLSRVLEPLTRLKDLILRSSSSNPQASFIRNGSSSEI